MTYSAGTCTSQSESLVSFPFGNVLVVRNAARYRVSERLGSEVPAMRVLDKPLCIDIHRRRSRQLGITRTSEKHRNAFLSTFEPLDRRLSGHDTMSKSAEIERMQERDALGLQVDEACERSAKGGHTVDKVVVYDNVTAMKVS